MHKAIYVQHCSFAGQPRNTKHHYHTAVNNGKKSSVTSLRVQSLIAW